jgi:hypothetical protein
VGTPALRRARAMARHQEEIAEWRESGPIAGDPDAFRREILPHLGSLTARQVAAATGYSESYSAKDQARRRDSSSKNMGRAPTPAPLVWG